MAGPQVHERSVAKFPGGCPAGDPHIPAGGELLCHHWDSHSHYPCANDYAGAFLETKQHQGEDLSPCHVLCGTAPEGLKGWQGIPGTTCPCRLDLWKGSQETLEREEQWQGSTSSPHSSETGSGCLKSTGKGLREARGLGPRKSPIGLDPPSVSQVTPDLHPWMSSRNEVTVGLLFGFEEAT